MRHHVIYGVFYTIIMCVARRGGCDCDDKFPPHESPEINRDDNVVANVYSNDENDFQESKLFLPDDTFTPREYRKNNIKCSYKIPSRYRNKRDIAAVPFRESKNGGKIIVDKIPDHDGWPARIDSLDKRAATNASSSLENIRPVWQVADPQVAVSDEKIAGFQGNDEPENPAVYRKWENYPADAGYNLPWPYVPAANSGSWTDREVLSPQESMNSEYGKPVREDDYRSFLKARESIQDLQGGRGVQSEFNARGQSNFNFLGLPQAGVNLNISTQGMNLESQLERCMNSSLVTTASPNDPSSTTQDNNNNNNNNNNNKNENIVNNNSNNATNGTNANNVKEENSLESVLPKPFQNAINNTKSYVVNFGISQISNEDTPSSLSSTTVQTTGATPSSGLGKNLQNYPENFEGSFNGESNSPYSYLKPRYNLVYPGAYYQQSNVAGYPMGSSRDFYNRYYNGYPNGYKTNDFANGIRYPGEKFKRDFQLVALPQNLYAIRDDGSNEGPTNEIGRWRWKVKNQEKDDKTSAMLSFKAHMHHRVEDIGKPFVKYGQDSYESLNRDKENVGASPASYSDRRASVPLDDESNDREEKNEPDVYPEETGEQEFVDPSSGPVVRREKPPGSNVPEYREFPTRNFISQGVSNGGNDMFQSQIKRGENSVREKSFSTVIKPLTTELEKLLATIKLVNNDLAKDKKRYSDTDSPRDGSSILEKRGLDSHANDRESEDTLDKEEKKSVPTSTLNVDLETEILAVTLPQEMMDDQTKNPKSLETTKTRNATTAFTVSSMDLETTFIPTVNSDSTNEADAPTTIASDKENDTKIKSTIGNVQTTTLQTTRRLENDDKTTRVASASTKSVDFETEKLSIVATGFVDNPSAMNVTMTSGVTNSQGETDRVTDNPARDSSLESGVRLGLKSDWNPELKDAYEPETVLATGDSRGFESTVDFENLDKTEAPWQSDFVTKSNNKVHTDDRSGNKYNDRNSSIEKILAEIKLIEADMVRMEDKDIPPQDEYDYEYDDEEYDDDDDDVDGVKLSGMIDEIEDEDSDNEDAEYVGSQDLEVDEKKSRRFEKRKIAEGEGNKEKLNSGMLIGDANLSSKMRESKAGKKQRVREFNDERKVKRMNVGRKKRTVIGEKDEIKKLQSHRDTSSDVDSAILNPYLPIIAITEMNLMIGDGGERDKNLKHHPSKTRNSEIGMTEMKIIESPESSAGFGVSEGNSEDLKQGSRETVERICNKNPGNTRLGRKLNSIVESPSGSRMEKIQKLVHRKMRRLKPEGKGISEERRAAKAFDSKEYFLPFGDLENLNLRTVVGLEPVASGVIVHRGRERKKRESVTKSDSTPTPTPTLPAFWNFETTERRTQLKSYSDAFLGESKTVRPFQTIEETENNNYTTSSESINHEFQSTTQGYLQTDSLYARTVDFKEKGRSSEPATDENQSSTKNDENSTKNVESDKDEDDEQEEWKEYAASEDTGTSVEEKGSETDATGSKKEETTESFSQTSSLKTEESTREMTFVRNDSTSTTEANSETTTSSLIISSHVTTEPFYDIDKPTTGDPQVALVLTDVTPSLYTEVTTKTNGEFSYAVNNNNDLELVSTDESTKGQTEFQNSSNNTKVQSTTLIFISQGSLPDNETNGSTALESMTLKVNDESESGSTTAVSSRLETFSFSTKQEVEKSSDVRSEETSNSFTRSTKRFQVPIEKTSWTEVLAEKTNAEVTYGSAGESMTADKTSGESESSSMETTGESIVSIGGTISMENTQEKTSDLYSKTSGAFEWTRKTTDTELASIRTTAVEATRKTFTESTEKEKEKEKEKEEERTGSTIETTLTESSVGGTSAFLITETGSDELKNTTQTNLIEISTTRMESSSIETSKVEVTGGSTGKSARYSAHSDSTTILSANQMTISSQETTGSVEKSEATVEMNFSTEPTRRSYSRETGEPSTTSYTVGPDRTLTRTPEHSENSEQTKTDNDTSEGDESSVTREQASTVSDETVTKSMSTETIGSSIAKESATTSNDEGIETSETKTTSTEKSSLIITEESMESNESAIAVKTTVGITSSSFDNDSWSWTNSLVGSTEQDSSTEKSTSSESWRTTEIYTKVTTEEYYESTEPLPEVEDYQDETTKAKKRKFTSKVKTTTEQEIQVTLPSFITRPETDNGNDWDNERISSTAAATSLVSKYHMEKSTPRKTESMSSGTRVETTTPDYLTTFTTAEQTTGELRVTGTSTKSETSLASISEATSANVISEHGDREETSPLISSATSSISTVGSDRTLTRTTEKSEQTKSDNVSSEGDDFSSASDKDSTAMETVLTAASELVPLSTTHSTVYNSLMTTGSMSPEREYTDRVSTVPSLDGKTTFSSSVSPEETTTNKSETESSSITEEGASETTDHFEKSISPSATGSLTNSILETDKNSEETSSELSTSVSRFVVDTNLTSAASSDRITRTTEKLTVAISERTLSEFSSEHSSDSESTQNGTSEITAASSDETTPTEVSSTEMKLSEIGKTTVTTLSVSNVSIEKSSMESTTKSSSELSDSIGSTDTSLTPSKETSIAQISTGERSKSVYTESGADTVESIGTSEFKTSTESVSHSTEEISTINDKTAGSEERSESEKTESSVSTKSDEMVTSYKKFENDLSTNEKEVATESITRSENDEAASDVTSETQLSKTDETTTETSLTAISKFATATHVNFHNAFSTLPVKPEVNEKEKDSTPRPVIESTYASPVPPREITSTRSSPDVKKDSGERSWQVSTSLEETSTSLSGSVINTKVILTVPFEETWTRTKVTRTTTSRGQPRTTESENQDTDYETAEVYDEYENPEDEKGVDDDEDEENDNRDTSKTQPSEKVSESTTRTSIIIVSDYEIASSKTTPGVSTITELESTANDVESTARESASSQSLTSSEVIKDTRANTESVDVSAKEIIKTESEKVSESTTRTSIIIVSDYEIASSKTTPGVSTISKMESTARETASSQSLTSGEVIKDTRANTESVDVSAKEIIETESEKVSESTTRTSRIIVSDYEIASSKTTPGVSTISQMESTARETASSQSLTSSEVIKDTRASTESVDLRTKEIIETKSYATWGSQVSGKITGTDGPSSIDVESTGESDPSDGESAFTYTKVTTEEYYKTTEPLPEAEDYGDETVNAKKSKYTTKGKTTTEKEIQVTLSSVVTRPETDSDNERISSTAATASPVSKYYMEKSTPGKTELISDTTSVETVPDYLMTSGGQTTGKQTSREFQSTGESITLKESTNFISSTYSDISMGTSDATFTHTEQYVTPGKKSRGPNDDERKSTEETKIRETSTSLNSVETQNSLLTTPLEEMPTSSFSSIAYSTENNTLLKSSGTPIYSATENKTTETISARTSSSVALSFTTTRLPTSDENIAATEEKANEDKKGKDAKDLKCEKKLEKEKEKEINEKKNNEKDWKEMESELTRKVGEKNQMQDELEKERKEKKELEDRLKKVEDEKRHLEEVVTAVEKKGDDEMKDKDERLNEEEKERNEDEIKLYECEKKNKDLERTATKVDEETGERVEGCKKKLDEQLAENIEMKKKLNETEAEEKNLENVATEVEKKEDEFEEKERKLANDLDERLKEEKERERNLKETVTEMNEKVTVLENERDKLEKELEEKNEKCDKESEERNEREREIENKERELEEKEKKLANDLERENNEENEFEEKKDEESKEMGEKKKELDEKEKEIARREEDAREKEGRENNKENELELETITTTTRKVESTESQERIQDESTAITERKGKEESQETESESSNDGANETTDRNAASTSPWNILTSGIKTSTETTEETTVIPMTEFTTSTPVPPIESTQEIGESDETVSTEETKTDFKSTTEGEVEAKESEENEEESGEEKQSSEGYTAALSSTGISETEDITSSDSGRTVNQNDEEEEDDETLSDEEDGQNMDNYHWDEDEEVWKNDARNNKFETSSKTWIREKEYEDEDENGDGEREENDNENWKKSTKNVCMKVIKNYDRMPRPKFPRVPREEFCVKHARKSANRQIRNLLSFDTRFNRDDERDTKYRSYTRLYEKLADETLEPIIEKNKSLFKKFPVIDESFMHRMWLVDKKGSHLQPTQVLRLGENEWTENPMRVLKDRGKCENGYEGVKERGAHPSESNLKETRKRRCKSPERTPRPVAETPFPTPRPPEEKIGCVNRQRVTDEPNEHGKKGGDSNEEKKTEEKESEEGEEGPDWEDDEEPETPSEDQEEYENENEYEEEPEEYGDGTESNDSRDYESGENDESEDDDEKGIGTEINLENNGTTEGSEETEDEGNDAETGEEFGRQTEEYEAKEEYGNGREEEGEGEGESGISTIGEMNEENETRENNIIETTASIGKAMGGGIEETREAEWIKKEENLLEAKKKLLQNEETLTVKEEEDLDGRKADLEMGNENMITIKDDATTATFVPIFIFQNQQQETTTSRMNVNETENPVLKDQTETQRPFEIFTNENETSIPDVERDNDDKNLGAEIYLRVSEAKDKGETRVKENANFIRKKRATGSKARGKPKLSFTVNVLDLEYDEEEENHRLKNTKPRNDKYVVKEIPGNENEDENIDETIKETDDDFTTNAKTIPGVEWPTELYTNYHVGGTRTWDKELDANDIGRVDSSPSDENEAIGRMTCFTVVVNRNQNDELYPSELGMENVLENQIERPEDITQEHTDSNYGIQGNRFLFKRRKRNVETKRALKEFKDIKLTTIKNYVLSDVGSTGKLIHRSLLGLGESGRNSVGEKEKLFPADLKETNEGKESEIFEKELQEKPSFIVEENSSDSSNIKPRSLLARVKGIINKAIGNGDSDEKAVRMVDKGKRKISSKKGKHGNKKQELIFVTKNVEPVKKGKSDKDGRNGEKHEPKERHGAGVSKGKHENEDKSKHKSEKTGSRSDAGEYGSIVPVVKEIVKKKNLGNIEKIIIYVDANKNGEHFSDPVNGGFQSDESEPEIEISDNLNQSFRGEEKFDEKKSVRDVSEFSIRRKRRPEEGEILEKEESLETGGRMNYGDERRMNLASVPSKIKRKNWLSKIEARRQHAAIQDLVKLRREWLRELKRKIRLKRKQSPSIDKNEAQKRSDRKESKSNEEVQEKSEANKLPQKSSGKDNKKTKEKAKAKAKAKAKKSKEMDKKKEGKEKSKGKHKHDKTNGSKIKIQASPKKGVEKSSQNIDEKIKIHYAVNADNKNKSKSEKEIEISKRDALAKNNGDVSNLEVNNVEREMAKKIVKFAIGLKSTYLNANKTESNKKARDVRNERRDIDSLIDNFGRNELGLDDERDRESLRGLIDDIVDVEKNVNATLEMIEDKLRDMETTESATIELSTIWDKKWTGKTRENKTTMEKGEEIRAAKELKDILEGLGKSGENLGKEKSVDEVKDKLERIIDDMIESKSVAGIPISTFGNDEKTGVSGLSSQLKQLGESHEENRKVQEKNKDSKNKVAKKGNRETENKLKMNKEEKKKLDKRGKEDGKGAKGKKEGKSKAKSRKSETVKEKQVDQEIKNIFLEDSKCREKRPDISMLGEDYAGDEWEPSSLKDDDQNSVVNESLKTPNYKSRKVQSSRVSGYNSQRVQNPKRLVGKSDEKKKSIKNRGRGMIETDKKLRGDANFRENQKKEFELSRKEKYSPQGQNCSHCICDITGVTEDLREIIARQKHDSISRIKRYNCTKFQDIGNDIVLTDIKERMIVPPFRARRGSGDFKRDTKYIRPEEVERILQANYSVKENNDREMIFLPGINLNLPCNGLDDDLFVIGLNRLNYTWLRPDGSFLSGTTIQKNGNLKIYDLNVKDAGKYSCIMSYVNPETEEEVRDVYDHNIQVVTLPTYSLQGVNRYKLDSCDEPGLDTLTTFLPEKLNQLLCANYTCDTYVTEPRCNRGKISINAILMPSSGTELLRTDPVRCDLWCRKAIQNKISLIFERNLKNILQKTIVFRLSNGNATLTPITNPKHSPRRKRRKSEIGNKNRNNDKTSGAKVALLVGCAGGYGFKNTNCYPCSPGRYSEEGSFRCKRCSPETYQPEPGARYCKTCTDPFVGGCFRTSWKHNSGIATIALAAGVAAVASISFVVCCFLRARRSSCARSAEIPTRYHFTKPKDSFEVPIERTCASFADARRIARNLDYSLKKAKIVRKRKLAQRRREASRLDRESAMGKKLTQKHGEKNTRDHQRYDRVCQLLPRGGLESYRSHLGYRHGKLDTRHDRSPPCVPLPDFDR